MLKMFMASGAGGSSHEFWDEAWQSQGVAAQLAAATTACEGSPVLGLLCDVLRPDRLFLEGGCGTAHWVKYLHDRGQRVVGVDFAEQTIAAVLACEPRLPVRVGRVEALPLESGSVHVYYSGGVVEHFEQGPHEALREARRVLAPDGYFFCSVPDASPFRKRVLYPERRGTPSTRGGFSVLRVEREGNDAVTGAQFFQYCFEEAEFCERLRAAGFRVERTLPIYLLNGLIELPTLGHLHDRLVAMRASRRAAGPAPGPLDQQPSSSPPPRAQPAKLAPPPASKLRRLLLREDPTVPYFGNLLYPLGSLFANMRMYVARPV